jgi:hypothetical protein
MHSIQAFTNVAMGIEKKTPQKPNMLPNTNTANIMMTGCSFTASEKMIGTNKLAI